MAYELNVLFPVVSSFFPHAFMPSATANRFAVVFASRQKNSTEWNRAMGNRSDRGFVRVKCWYPTSVLRFFFVVVVVGGGVLDDMTMMMMMRVVF